MNIGPSEADQLSMRDYEGILWNWNRVHSPEDQHAEPDLERLAGFMAAHSVH